MPVRSLTGRGLLETSVGTADRKSGIVHGSKCEGKDTAKENWEA